MSGPGATAVQRALWPTWFVKPAVDESRYIAPAGTAEPAEISSTFHNANESRVAPARTQPVIVTGFPAAASKPVE